MNLDAIQTIAVIGAGQMGSGIAQVLSGTAEIKVNLMDVTKDLADKGKNTVSKFLNSAVKKGKLEEEKVPAILDRIQTHDKLESAADADFIIEAATENQALKLDIFNKLDGLAKEQVIIASNTSSIPITRIANATKRPDRVIGMHFFNPVPIMKLVEVVAAMQTSDETVELTIALGEKMDKTCVHAKDSPGFISNRILMPYINEAFCALQDGIGDAKGIDQVMKLGTNVPMGPLTLADFIGLDTCLSILEVLYQGTYDPKYRPSPLLRKYVDAGYLGRKTKQGVYQY